MAAIRGKQSRTKENMAAPKSGQTATVTRQKMVVGLEESVTCGCGEVSIDIVGTGSKKVGLAPRFDGLRSAEQWRGLNAGHGTTNRKSDGNRGGRDTLGKFGDDEKIVISFGEESSMNGAAKIFNRNAYGVEAGLRIANQLIPSVGGVADLVAKVRHASLLTW
jgi:hypothetical protein